MIIVDVDCVVADLVGSINKLIEKSEGYPIPREAAHKYNWFLSEYSKETANYVVNTIKSSSEFWETMDLIPGAQEGIKILRDWGHRIIWCTRPYPGKYGWVDDRRNWLEEQFQISEHDEIYAPVKDKWIVSADYFIDDIYENLQKWRYWHIGQAFLFAAEHNHDAKVRRFTWEDINKINWDQGPERCSL